MTDVPRHGRPRASSRQTLAEAASELFLEQGYDATSASDIARRAGVSRSSFFNYFATKDDVFWSEFDAHVAGVDALLAASDADAAGVREALTRLASEFSPDMLSLGFTHAEAMGITADLQRGSAVRQAALAERIAARLGRGVSGRVRGGVFAAIFMAAVRTWAESGPGRTTLAAVLRECDAALDD